ncbi:hypothetical protein LCGC14_0500960 [marine sediment metagenome]|uniref:Uncharacterized protein n=1 Tax=marine sediment metagenome TaxID=412755 RepID=A0A0F9UQR7_9ZZZZ|nr:hypothetical protein [Candidatus Aminicenantes bacterium]
MIKAKINETTFLLGFSDENIKRMREGKPIKLNMADMDGPDINIFIVTGASELAIIDDLKSEGMINMFTKINK